MAAVGGPNIKEKLRNFYTVVGEGHVRKAVLLAGLGPAGADLACSKMVCSIFGRCRARPAAGGIGCCAEELTRGRGSGTAVTYFSNT